jgi:hypothetical protein
MKLKSIGGKELIISLIKDDLTNVHLVGGLRRIGLNTDNHDLHLSETVLKIIGFNENDLNEGLYKEYFNRSQKIIDMNIIEFSKELDNIVYDIYTWLVEEKKKRV